ncbi:MAG: hypothetical protein ACFNLL_08850 [Bacteroides sp.]
MNKALTEYTPKAHLTGEACLAPTIAPKARTVSFTILPEQPHISGTSEARLARHLMTCIIRTAYDFFMIRRKFAPL